MNYRSLLVLLALMTAGLSSSSVARAASVFDTPADQVVTALTPELVKRDPMSVLFMAAPPWDDRTRVLELMRENVQLYAYMPESLRADPEILALAEALGLPKGVKITKETQARVLPSPDAKVALGPSDTTNGYLADVRPVQSFAADDLLQVFDTKTVDGTVWVKVTEARPVPRSEDKNLFQMLSNVGGVDFKDFSHTVDEGWIPATSTEPAILSARYITGLYRLASVQNGDMGIYVDFDEQQFSGFDRVHYTLMMLLDGGQISPGDRIRVVWKESLLKSEEPELVWLPFKPWEPSEASP